MLQLVAAMRASHMHFPSQALSQGSGGPQSSSASQNRHAKRKKKEENENTLALLDIVAKNVILTGVTVCSTVVVIALYGYVQLEILMYCDMMVNISMAVLMYAMYQNEYQFVCGRLHKRVRSCS